MNRKVKNSAVSLAAEKPSKKDMDKAKLIYKNFEDHCKLEDMNLDWCIEQELLWLNAELVKHKELTPTDQQLEAPAMRKAAGLLPLNLSHLGVHYTGGGSGSEPELLRPIK